jgi:hypothetical protein
MGPIWFIRMAQWARNPPSAKKVKLVVGVVVLCFALWGIELLGFWPEFLHVNPPARP